MTGMHRLAAKQIARCKSPDGKVDVDCLMGLVSSAYQDFDSDRRRTDRSMTLMIDELQAFNEQLENLVELRTSELQTVQRTLQFALDNIHHGIMMIDRDRRLQVCNRRAVELLNLPPDVLARPESFRDSFARRAREGGLTGADDGFVRWMLGDSDAAMQAEYQRTKQDGTVLHVTQTRLPDGSSVRTFTDVTHEVEHDTALRLAEEEYRGVFDNAVFGIYRAGVDGQLMRANPALVKLMGFASEDDMRRTTVRFFDEMFVDPLRRKEFARLMRDEGRVTDFVAEIFRHVTGERMWISQNAWAIRDADGRILFYEGSVIDSTERKRSEEKVAHMAHHDILTNLPNRAYFHAQLQEVAELARDGVMSALCYIDLDRFKEVNDALGHATGDQLLSAVARRLKSCVHRKDIVARLGGDEFAIVQRDISSVADTETLAARIVERISKPYRLGRHRVTIGVSLGFALTPREYISPRALTHNADLALYRAKSEGGQRYRAFDKGMFGDLVRRRTLTADMREVLKRDELTIHYQPIVHLTHHETIGFEALLRWTHPRLGNISPQEFIPIAEETGLIIQISDWVLRESCNWIAAHSPSLGIAVNISAVEFKRGAIRPRVMNALAASGLNASRLTLEITESAFLADDQTTITALDDMRKLGVHIALDDFGTGYSSLTYLQKFRIDAIKIDRSFTAKIDHDQVNAAAVRAIIALGRDLKIPVVAEGVETAAEVSALMALGCARAQGFLFGRPAPSDAWFPPGKLASPAPDNVAELPPFSRNARAGQDRKQRVAR